MTVVFGAGYSAAIRSGFGLFFLSLLAATLAMYLAGYLLQRPMVPIVMRAVELRLEGQNARSNALFWFFDGLYFYFLCCWSAMLAAVTLSFASHPEAHGWLYYVTGFLSAWGASSHVVVSGTAARDPWLIFAPFGWFVVFCWSPGFLSFLCGWWLRWTGV